MLWLAAAREGLDDEHASAAAGARSWQYARFAVVTGGTTGIGRATAKHFATEGARVFVTGRRQAELDAAVEAIGPGATGVQADSANLSDLNRLYERVKTEAGRIDVLFVNAGGGSMLRLGSIQADNRTAQHRWRLAYRARASLRAVDRLVTD